VLLGGFSGITVLWLKAKREKQGAEKRWELAWGALDAMSSDLIEEWLLKQNDLSPHHFEFLEKITTTL
jgi:hypothetical protein